MASRPLEVYDRTGTCDSCAAFTNVRLEDPGDGRSQNVCSQCDDHFDKAVEAAAVVLAIELGHVLASLDPPKPAPNTERITRRVIEAFIAADIEIAEDRHAY